MARIKRDLKPQKPYDDDDDFGIAGEGDEPEDESLFEPDDDVVDDEPDKVFDDLLEPAKVIDDDGENEVADEPVKKPKLPKGKKPPAEPISPVGKYADRRTIVLGQVKKLTKKAEASLKDWRGKNHGKKLESLLAGHVQAARQKFGQRGVFHGDETKDLIVGIPTPALPFEFVIANDVFPLGLVIQLVAKHGTGKSGLLAEFNRWFDDAGGFSVTNENETKFSPEWYESIMGDDAFKRMILNRCDSVESWQKHLSFDIDNFKKLMDGTNKAPGPGRTFPINLGVDSVMGKLSEDSQENVRVEGAAGRGFPVEALKITRYLRTIPQWLDGWPFSLVLVNHLRMRKDENNHEERDKAGGALINFQESFELELRKGGPKKIETSDYEGFYIDIICEKNSFGPTHRSIRTRVLWWDELDEKTGEYKQKTVWDWNWSICHLLWSILKGGEKNVMLRKRLNDVDFHMEFNSPTALSATAWSKTLGVSRKDPLLWSQMGALIKKTPDVLSVVKKALRIKKRSILRGDYLQQIDKMSKELP